MLYSVFIKKNSDGKIDNVVFLKDGMSFYALLFNPLWFLYHKMWKEFFAMIAILLLLSTTFPAENFLGAFLQIAFFLIVAFNCNYWLGEHLRKKDFTFAAMVFGKNISEAKVNFVRDSQISFDDLSQNL